MKKPLLRPQNKEKRLAWAKKHLNWMINRWEKIFRTMSHSFEYLKRRVFVCQRKGERARGWGSVLFQRVK